MTTARGPYKEVRRKSETFRLLPAALERLADLARETGQAKSRVLENLLLNAPAALCSESAKGGETDN